MNLNGVKIEGSRFLVVGGAGFIGSHVVDELLSHGARTVRVYDNFVRGKRTNLAAALTDPRCEILRGADVLHRDMLSTAMSGIDGVFHLAALWLLDCIEYPRAAFDINVVGTMNVIEAAAAAGVRRLVFSSSASVYGDAQAEPMTEDHVMAGTDFYGATKICGEVLLRSLGASVAKRGTDFSAAGLRYMNVYGPRQDDEGPFSGVVMEMLKALDAGEAPVIHGDGRQAFDFIHVQDCARANLLAMANGKPGRMYNVSTGIKTSVNELADLICGLHPHGRAPRMMPSDRPSVRSRVGSTELARDDLGFTSNIALQVGLRDLIQARRSGSGART